MLWKTWNRCSRGIEVFDFPPFQWQGFIYQNQSYIADTTDIKLEQLVFVYIDVRGSKGCFNTIVESCTFSLRQEDRPQPIHPLCTASTNGHKECTLKMLAEDEWMKMHSELLTNGVKHTHTTDTHTEFTAKMDDGTGKMLPELNCSWQMSWHLSACTDPLLWLTMGGLFCDLTRG